DACEDGDGGKHKQEVPAAVECRSFHHDLAGHREKRRESDDADLTAPAARETAGPHRQRQQCERKEHATERQQR
ncbi:hypothetical protein QIG90_27455, partial [Klebsiella pneumoniae]|nr:hypothetical protein [Klebsiella pneumoniae]